MCPALQRCSDIRAGRRIEFPFIHDCPLLDPPIRAAAHQGWPKVVQILLDLGADHRGGVVDDERYNKGRLLFAPQRACRGSAMVVRQAGELASCAPPCFFVCRWALTAA